MPKGRRKYRVLVVDDEKEVADMLGQMLRRMGYISVICTESLRALTLFSEASERFDAVILDEMMPDLRGTQMALRLLEMKDGIPIILLTGHGERMSLGQVRESGVRATLIKPVLRDELQRALERVLGRAKQIV